MKVAILGAGFVGSSLGKAFLQAGHQVMFSSRDAHGPHAQKIAAETGAPVGSIADTIDFSQVIVLAMPADAVMDLVAEYAGKWQDKILIDLNNKLGPSPLKSAGSFGQELAVRTGGKVVKAFNVIGAEHFLNPVFDGLTATLFIAGDDPAAKQVVSDLAASIGFEVVDAGGIEASVHLENLAEFWIYLVRHSGMGRNIAFKLIRR